MSPDSAIEKRASTKIGIIAGNRLLPIVIARKIREKTNSPQIVAICFKGETKKAIVRYVDKAHWIAPGNLKSLRQIIRQVGLKEWIMAGQISPRRIFNSRQWDEELASLIRNVKDLRPHTIFSEIINHLNAGGISFLDSTLYLKDCVVQRGVINGVKVPENIIDEINFGLAVISRFVELDVGQTIAVKRKSVVALESLEGTDQTILRAWRIAGKGIVVLKFSKANQDLRFDVPVVGLSTLRLLRRIRAAALVLEKEKVIILEKEKFLSQAREWRIPVIGA